METLEHFRIYKPKPSTMSTRDVDGYNSIDLEALGAKIEYVDMFPDEHRGKPWKYRPSSGLISISRSYRGRKVS